MIREDHPYDDGYWARYDNKRRPTDVKGRQGWDDCNRELREEHLAISGNDKTGAA